jgi:hypothetical protein
MERALTKSPILVGIDYSTGDHVELYAGPITSDERDGVAYLVLDVSKNLHTRNKQENTYIDACELAERLSDVRIIEIDEQLVAKWVGWSSVPRRERSLSERRLQILLERKSFTYSIDNARNNGAGRMAFYLQPEGNSKGVSPMIHLEDVVEEIATGRQGKVDSTHGEGPSADQQTTTLWRVHFSDGKEPMMQYFKSEAELRVVRCPHSDSGSGFVPARSIMDPPY